MIKAIQRKFCGRILFFIIFFVSAAAIGTISSAKIQAQTDSSLKNLTCIYPVKVAGNSMEPTFKDGTTVFLNKCINDKKKDLTAGTIIVYNQFGRMKLAVIREKIVDDRGGLYYKTSPQARPSEIADVFPDNITGIYSPESSSSADTNAPITTSNFHPNPALIIGGVLTMMVFFLSIFYWRKKTNAPWVYFKAGLLVWSAMIVLKIAMDLTISPKIIGLGLIFSSLYFGLRTGIFENGLSFFYAKKKLVNADFDSAVAFGISFGGVEALLIGLQSAIFSLLLVLKPEMINAFPANIRQELVTVYTSSSLFIFAPVIERVAALFIHIFTTVLVFLALRTGKKSYLLLAVFFKTIVDGMILPLSQFKASSFLVWAYLMEIPIAFLGLIGFFGIRKLKEIYPKDSV